MLRLTGSFSFRITSVKIEIHQPKELGIQWRQHTTNKKIARLRDRQNENKYRFENKRKKKQEYAQQEGFELALLCLFSFF